MDTCRDESGDECKKANFQSIVCNDTYLARRHCRKTCKLCGERIATLSHDNPCFQCNITFTNFLVSHTCEIRFHDVISQITSDVKVKILHDQMSMFWNLTFNLIRWIFDKNNLALVDCCDKILLYSS